MDRLKKKKLGINETITRKVIELQNEGYDFDFLLLGSKVLLCMQNNRRYPVRDVMVNNVKSAYDDLSHSYKHVHTVETSNGERGVLLSDASFN